MKELIVLSTSIVEPVTVADVRDHMGYPTTDQDAKIGRMIRVAREWIESKTAVSLVNKQYKAYFEKEDARNSWYELPISPVLDDPALVVAVNGVAIDFETKGLSCKSVRPYGVFGTIPVGATTATWYMEVTFNAGAESKTGNEIICRIVSTMFNARDDGGGEAVTVGRLPYDTLRLIETINQNVGL